MPRYRKFAAALGFFALAIGLINELRYVGERDFLSIMALTNAGPFWVIFVLCVGWFLSRGGLVVRWSQMLVTASLSYFYLYSVSTSSAGGEIMLVFAIFLAHKHGLLETRPLLKAGGMSAIGFAILVVKVVDGNIPSYGLLLRLAVLGTGTMVIWILFEDDIRRLLSQRGSLVAKMQAQRAFVEFGRNVVGIVHDLKGDISLPAMAA